MKDKDYIAGKDKPITEDVSTRTPIIKKVTKKGVIKYNKKAYNCHSYAWHNSKGDPTDPANSGLVSVGVKRWDNNAADDLGDSTQLAPDDPNQIGDRVIYFFDQDGNGRYDAGEPIDHSAIVTSVDVDGNTTEVTGKMGERGISVNHPRAPKYYDVHMVGRRPVGPTSRAYFRPN
jgi:hypothetical protein